MNWIKERFAERTTLDGVVLIAVGVVIVMLGDYTQFAAYAAIGYGAWTIVKSEGLVS